MGFLKNTITFVCFYVLLRCGVNSLIPLGEKWGCNSKKPMLNAKPLMLTCEQWILNFELFPCWPCIAPTTFFYVCDLRTSKYFLGFWLGLLYSSSKNNYYN